MTTMLGAFDTVFWGVITFSILIVLHEMGHFLAARAFGIKVHEFMVGLPGPALRIRTKNMAWGVTAIPLGGYVRIAGMEPGPEDDLLGPALAFLRDAPPATAHDLARALGVDDGRAEAMLATLRDWKAVAEEPDGRHRLALEGDLASLDPSELLARARQGTYRAASTPTRLAILSMGVLTNLLVAFLTFTVVLSVWGYERVTTRIGVVDQGAPASAAGVREGDRLIALDGEPVEDWESFLLSMARTKQGQTVVLTVERDGQQLDIAVPLAGREGHGFLGIGPTLEHVQPTVVDSLKEGLRLTGLVFRTIADLFNPKTFATTVQNVRGVVGVSVMAAEAAHAGPLSYAWLVALLSLSLGVMNVLPIPPLDGGKMAMEIVERVMGRPINRAVSLGLSAIGAVLLFSLIGYVMYADIVRLAQ